MDAIIDEILYLYFKGYYINDILNSIKINQCKEEKMQSKKIEKKKAKVIKESYIEFGPPKTKPPKSFTKLDIEEHEALVFNKALKGKLNLTPGSMYKVFTTKRKKSTICFIGEFKEQNERHIRLKHKLGYSETFLKSDLISGEYLIKEA